MAVITISNQPVSKGIRILDTTDYQGGQSYFNYIKINVTDINGVITSYGNNIPSNPILPPSDFGNSQPSYDFPDYTLSGAYTFQYIVMGELGAVTPFQGFLAGSPFYFSGSYYICNSTFFSPYPSVATSTFISTNLNNGKISVIQESELTGSYVFGGETSTYIDTITFASWSNLLPCLLDTLSKYNCKIKEQAKAVKLPCIDGNNDNIDTDTLDLILQLNFIYQYLIVVPQDPTNVLQLATIKSFANYINQNCSCVCECK